jgi:hypothetical protein
VTAPQVGVLVPVRLETRFVAPSRVPRWRLRVRVVPDAMSLTNHDDRASVDELDAVEAMWRAVGGQGLESAEGRRAWRDLARAVGAERAAWLARTFPPVTGPDGAVTIARPSQTRTTMRPPKVMGLPPAIELWLARSGRPPFLAATLTVLAEGVDLDLDDPNETKQPWWVSFEEAVRVGLAAELDLGTAVPDDIDALYVVGVGGGDPGPLLTSQADAGRLGVVAPGSATNSVDGAEAVSLGDADAWRRLVTVGTTEQEGTAAISKALVGAPVVRGVIGGEKDHRPVNGALVGVLWPALWGHSLSNVWGYAGQADELGLWAAANLVPEGPLPSLRIGNQPYGLLPATSLRRWRAADEDPEIEDRLVPLVRTLVDTWAAAAERQAARPADAFGDLVHNPAAARHAWRWMLPTALAHALSFRFDEPVPALDLDSWWTRQVGRSPRLDPDAEPARQLVSIGWSHGVDLRLVEPDDLPAGTTIGRGLSRLAGASVAELLDAGPVEGRARASPPWGTSVLTELARHSLVASAAAVGRRAAGQSRVLVEPVSVDERTATETETWALRMQQVDLSRRGEPTVGVRRNVVDGLRQLATADVADIDRGLRAALETATNRLDPWATAIAWRRLQDLAAAPRTLGVYGWVDAPRPRQTASDNRFTLAPSTDQAAVTAVLRDRALHDPDADRWEMNVASDPIRDALRLADMTREGAHPLESLGQMVEAMVQRPAVIDRLRAAFPSVQAFVRDDLKIRRVCNGAAVLEAAADRPGDLLGLGVSTAQVTSLRELAAAVDALADLHVAEAVLGVVKGRTANVAAATTAAAGQAPPPGFEIVRTPRAGRVVNTVVVIVLPDARGPTGTRPSPTALGDPAVAAYLDARSGAAAGPSWRWTKLDPDGATDGTVTLADVGLRPCDTVGLGTANLRDVVRLVSGAAGLGPDDPPGHARVRALAAALAGVPALPEDVGERQEGGATAAELADRYKRVRAAAVAAAADARQTIAPTATEAARRSALGRLARWGITPLAADVDDPTIGTLADRVLRAAETLERRIDESAPALDDVELSVLATSIGALVAPEAPWPVFSRLPAAALEGVRAEPAAAGTAPRLDPDWLETVAPVRPALGRLEAVQLDQRLATGGQPLRAWSNRPGDPWQTVAPPPSDTEVVRPSRLVAAFGPPGVLPTRPVTATGGKVAVAVVDRFAETIPDAEHVGSVAFSHDLPPARAPQAVLLAVPPVLDEEMTGAVLVDIVAEVRQLARTRMADVAQLGAASDVLHLAALPASGRVGVQLGGP